MRAPRPVLPPFAPNLHSPPTTPPPHRHASPRASRRLAQEVKGQTDETGEQWMRGGAALAGMLGASEGQQAESITRLAAVVKRVIAAQPSLVHVQAPAKVFGDVHGQLRDLLLLFAYYGPLSTYPPHTYRV